MVRSCEHGNEPSFSTKGRGCTGLVERLLASHKGLCSMELVIYIASLRVPVQKTRAISTFTLSNAIHSGVLPHKSISSSFIKVCIQNPIICHMLQSLIPLYFDEFLEEVQKLTHDGGGCPVFVLNFHLGRN